MLPIVSVRFGASGDGCHVIAFGVVTCSGSCVASWGAEDTGDQAVPARVSFGIISDVHYGVLDWARPGTGMVELDFVRAFLGDMQEQEVDFIIQLGDFCKPSDGQPMLDLWNTFPGPKYHVWATTSVTGGIPSTPSPLGWGCRRGTTLSIRARFEASSWMPTNRGAEERAMPPTSGSEQQQWLTRQLAETDRPVLVFVHQPIEALRNSAEVMAVLEQAERDRPGVIMAVFCGHHHQDYMLIKHNIPFIQINSASYVWYDPVRTVRYAEPLWGRVTIDFARAFSTGRQADDLVRQGSVGVRRP
jgi:3',5'-cyclic-AMP phosphodiesterase